MHAHITPRQTVSNQTRPFQNNSASVFHSTHTLDEFRDPPPDTAALRSYHQLLYTANSVNCRANLIALPPHSPRTLPIGMAAGTTQRRRGAMLHTHALSLALIATLALHAHGKNLYGEECYGGCFFTTCSGQTSFYVNSKSDAAFEKSAICIKTNARVRAALKLSDDDVVVAAHSGSSLRVRRVNSRYEFNDMRSVSRGLPSTLFKSYAMFRPKCSKKGNRHLRDKKGNFQYTPTGRYGIGRQSLGGGSTAKLMQLADKCYLLRINWFSVRNRKTGKVRHLTSSNTRSCVAFYAVYNKDDDKDGNGKPCEGDSD